MNFISRIFGSDKAIEAGTNGIINGVDKMFYTTEEKADNFARMMTLYEPFKLGQRVIATILVPPWALAWMITFIVSFFHDTARQEALLGGRMGDAVTVVVAFYFMGGMAEGTVRAVHSLKTRISDQKTGD